MVPIIPKQRQHKPTASKRFNALIEYLQGEQEQAKQAQQEPGTEPGLGGGRVPQSSEFSDLLDYATAPVDTKIKGEKCIAVRTHGVSSIETASVEMNAVSRKNMRCEDPVYHFILSWPEHERPATAAIFDAAEHAIRSLGFEDHQYVIAIHANTDNLHCHVAMNRVHPTTFKSRHIEWAKRTLHFAARESEIKHGWTHDNGIYVVEVNGQGEKQIVLNAKRAKEAEEGVHVHPEVEREEELPSWHDPEGLESWLKTKVAKALREALQDLGSWQALHVWLGNYGIELQDTGGGGMRLRAVSPETGEILETPASKGLRALKRADLEKRWGAFKPMFTNPVISPPQEHLTPAQLEEGASYVIGLGNDLAREFGLDQFGPPPPDHVHGPAPGREDGARPVPQGSSGLHDLPGGRMAVDGQLAGELLPGAVQGDVGDGQAGQDSRVRHHAAGPGQSTGRGAERVSTGLDAPAGRKPRDPAKRAERKAERAAQRVDLRRRYTTYRNFVQAADTEHFTRLKELRRQRSEAIQEVNASVKAAKAALPRGEAPEVRLLALVEIEAEAARRKLEAHARFEQRADSLRVTRVPPLSWRHWLFEQSNRGDKAALSALRGIVYQAKRDAKLDAGEDLDDLDPAAADYHEQQHKRLMRRLLEEERKEAAIRASTVHAMRPHEVDALILLYAGMTWRVTGNGNVEYSSAEGDHLFTDRGNRVTFDRVRVTDDEIKLALAHSREKFGRQLTLSGEDDVFTARMARLAVDMGLVVLNPELQDMLQVHRATSRAAAADQQLAAVAQPPAIGARVEEPARPKDTLADLHALVLGIDPRASFVEADPRDEARVYIGPVAAEIGEESPMFAQHLGRSVYAIHKAAVPPGHDSQPIDIRYRSGRVEATVTEKQSGRTR